MALERDYEVLGRLGEGSFGTVYKARHRSSDEIVAVKQIKLGSKSWEEACRSTELQALRTLRHPFVVRLRELMRSPDDGSLYYVFEFVGSDLVGLIQRHPTGLPEDTASRLMRQLLVGLAYIHQSNFFHRDIKPENILFDAPSETLRIADFGEARSLRARPPFTDYIGTRWYRAPECILRDGAYSSPVDVWAAGLVFAELVRGAPVFRGKTSIDQLYQILQVLGKPSAGDWPEYNRMADAIRFRAPERGCGLERVLPNASGVVRKLVCYILVLNPRKRPPARKCLEHELIVQLPAMSTEEAQRRPSKVSVELDCAVPTDDPGVAIENEPLESRGMMAPYAATEAQQMESSIGATAGRPAENELDLDAELDKILGSEPSDGETMDLQQDKNCAVAASVHSSRAETPSTGYTSACGNVYSTVSSLGADRVSQHQSDGQEKPALDDVACVDDLLDSLCADLAMPEPDGKVSSLSVDVKHTVSNPVRANVSEASASAEVHMCHQSHEDAHVRAINFAGHRLLDDPVGPMLAPSCTAVSTGVWSNSPASSSRSAKSSTWDEEPAVFPPASVSSAKQGDLNADDDISLAEIPHGRGSRPSVSRHDTQSAWLDTQTTAEASTAATVSSYSPTQVRQASNPEWFESLADEADCEAQTIGDQTNIAAVGTPTPMPQVSLVREGAWTLSHPPTCSGAWAAQDVSHGSSESPEPDRVDAPVDLENEGTPENACPNVFSSLDQKHQATLHDSHSSDPEQNSVPGSSPNSWSGEESRRLRKVVKRLFNEGCKRDDLWLVVSSQMGNGRSAKDCKRQYRDDYRAHKSSTGAATKSSQGRNRLE